jgi:hypothetical protein
MPRTADEQIFWDERFREAWQHCLKELGLKGAMGCVSIARDAADSALAQRRESISNGTQS